MGDLQIDRAQARRIAVRAQMLDLPRPGDLVEVVQQLSLLQIDPAAPIAPSAELVLWSRLGAAYRSADLQQALETRTLVEFNGMVRPVEDLPAHLAGAEDWPRDWEQARGWLRANDPFRQDVLNRLEDHGPLLSKEIPDTSLVSWPSSGWTNDRNVTQMLEFLVMRAEVAVSGRRGRQRVFDLAERVYPDQPAMTVDEARRHRDERRLTSLGIARAKGTKMPSEPVDVGEAGLAVTVDGVDGRWRVDPVALERDETTPFRGRAALLSPYDRLVYDRSRAQDLFGFEYVLEVYKPASKRRWGYYALPILFGDRLIGKLDAKAERKEGILEVHAVHQDVTFTDEMTTAVEAEIDALADWLGLARLR
ncbi:MULTISPECIES: DNA glycosylase AlkZ-like family protein [unclassified Phycicoccus]|uniref:DNA glycosylase AlkZ-like family protein n=1 Tax=unclassified Phycicoccus TaxID=2637926 RepID=UPI000AB81FDD|nr:MULTISPECIES: crosslink repair DNA glycosylase YcaQ family protein [unclassified Phycicoccus]